MSPARTAPYDDLVSRYRTPLYVYRLDRLREAAADLRRWLPEGAVVYYSLKANPHPRLVAELGGAGLRAEVSSPGELRAALAGGCPAEHCLYTGPGKTPDEVAAALRAGVRLFSVESRADHDRLARAAEKQGVQARCLLRLHAPTTARGALGLRMTGTRSQFGIPWETAAAHPELLRSSGPVRTVGLHFFSVSNVGDPEVLAKEFEAGITAAAELADRTGMPLELLDLGGGFAAPYARPGDRPHYPGLSSFLARTLDAHLPEWRRGHPTIAFESGRYLAADCGTLLTTVLDVKDSHRGSHVVLDAGTNTLGGMAGLGRIPAHAARPLQFGDGEDHGEVTLVGPLCTPLDVLSRGTAAPLPRIGDVLHLPNVGAYKLTAGLLGFLSRTAPVEVVLDRGAEVVEARRVELQVKEVTGTHER